GQSIERDVISSSGDSYVSSGLLLDVTIGETIINTYSSTGLIITQGFQQPIPDTIVFVVDNEDRLLEIICFPNPTSDIVNIRIVNHPNKKIKLRVYNLLGGMILQKTLLPNIGNTIEHQMNVSYFPAGNYLINFYNMNHQLSSFKLIKTN
ncbi:T9SS type A sorting domain-containing protein, partial [candidate division KSB1 bacterium]